MDIKETRKCPVCGKYNQYESYSEWGFGTVEQHYILEEWKNLGWMCMSQEKSHDS